MVALPMLIVIKLGIDRKVTAVGKYFAEALMNQEKQQEALSIAFRQAKKLTSSALTEIILLLIMIGVTIGFIKGGAYSALESGTTSWMTYTKNGSQALSNAGYCHYYFHTHLSISFLRWLWKYFVWILLLFRLSKAKMNLFPTHSDRAGGLGIIMLAQRSFNLIFIAAGVAISGELITQLLEHPDSLKPSEMK
jgi:hypothetical protein